MPHGLYTARIVVMSNTSSPPPEWSAGDWFRLRSCSRDNVLFAANSPREPSVCVNPNRIRAAMMVIRNFTRTQ
jgi:hypothetical protein